MQPIKILKFGGSSISEPERISRVVEIVIGASKDHSIAAVVFSAFGGITDQLIQLGSKAASGDKTVHSLLDETAKRHQTVVDELIPQKFRPAVLAKVNSLISELSETIHGVSLVKELTPKTLDFILSFGERLSAGIICDVIVSRDIQAEYLDTRPLVKTDSQFGSARVKIDATYQHIRSHFASHPAMQIATGFIGSTEKNETTTLGRGGSDYSAALIGAALDAAEVEIWTDVNGFMTADPRKVKKVFSIESLSYEEAMELSHFGAKVIYPPTLQPASELSIPVRIKNTFNPEFRGTVIGSKSPSAFQVTGISSIDQIALLLIEGSGMIGVVGISNRLFGSLAKNRISVILISQASSEHSICIAVTPQSAEAAKNAIEDEFALEILAKQVDPVVIEWNLSIVAVVGENMRRTPGIAGRLFQALGKNGVNVAAIAQGSSELNISVVIPQSDESKALNALHETFFLSQTKTLNVYLIGTGLIGSTLLRQMKEQQAFLSGNHALEIRLIAVGNIDRMLFSGEGISLSAWSDELDRKGVAVDLEKYIDTMKTLNLPNSILVDCTGSGAAVSLYEKAFDSSISIVTPNKIANSGKYEQYRRLKNAAAKHGVKFLYETNVGAGLPVISTLNDLLASGDRILKIEAVLSGTLSYIFNSFSKDMPFSAAVKTAMERGLSEPDPRTDLNGVDVARKILILARETGLPLEPGDVVLEPILSEQCGNAKTLESFFKLLESEDKGFELRRSAAERKNMKIRYIAALENGKARVALKEVDGNDPFYALSGSDNMIVFTTERYRERPLVIKGPGAGAEVTAAGVFADIIRIGSYLS